jgi:hypothetical protein
MFLSLRFSRVRPHLLVITCYLTDNRVYIYFPKGTVISVMIVNLVARILVVAFTQIGYIFDYLHGNTLASNTILTSQCLPKGTKIMICIYAC